MTTPKYKQAIDILMSSNIDLRAIVVEIAKSHPTIFVNAHKKLQPTADWRNEARILMLRNNKIAAIKHCRAITGMSLMEAKEACEALV